MIIQVDVGEIEQLFLWTVRLPGFWQDNEDICFTSPPFRFLDSTMQLSLGTKHKGWIGFYLLRVDSGSPIEVTYGLEISTTGGFKTFTKTHIFQSSNRSSGEPEVLEMSKMNPPGEKNFHDLKIACRIINNSSDALQEIKNTVREEEDGGNASRNLEDNPNSVSTTIETKNSNSGTKEERHEDKDRPLLDKKETPNSVSCGNQGKILDGIPCAIQTDVPNHVSCVIEAKKLDCRTEEEKLEDKDWPPLDKKETPNSVSCAIQTEVTDNVSCANQTENLNSVSCAIQTQVPDSVSCEVQTETNNENSEDEGWSSLDVKEIKILRDCLKELLSMGNSQDVTICVQDKEFRVHRSILIARSPVFAMMLTHDTKENKTGTIDIPDCDPESFKEFLLYVYSGRTGKITPSKAIQLYYPADKYDFPVLKERCASLLKTSLSITSICDVIILATNHEEKELLRIATEFFARNIKEILQTVDWQNFVSRNPVQANELIIKSVNFLLP